MFLQLPVFIFRRTKFVFGLHLPAIQFLQERDDQIRRSREDAAQAQKKLQQQLEEELGQQAELKEQLAHLSLRKEELKQQLEDKDAELEEIRRVYRQESNYKLKYDAFWRKKITNYEIKLLLWLT